MPAAVAELLSLARSLTLWVLPRLRLPLPPPPCAVDNQRRFAMFCKAAIESLRALPFMPGEDCLIVANDWHTAMVPVLLKQEYQKRGEFRDVKVRGW